MPRRSSIKALPKPVLDAVHRVINEGRLTNDELVEAIGALGHKVSWSAVQRYRSDMEGQLQRYREAREVAGVWTTSIQEDPEGQVARLVGQLITMAAFESVSRAQGGEGTFSPQDLMFLSSAIKNLGSAEQMAQQRVIKARAEAKKEAAEAVEKVAVSAGLSAPTIQGFRAAILGVPS